VKFVIVNMFVDRFVYPISETKKKKKSS